MRDASRIEEAIRLLNEVIPSDKPAEGIINYYFRKRRYIGSKDRSEIKSHVYRIMRAWHRLSWWLIKADMDVNARNLMIADLMLNDKVREAVAAGKFHVYIANNVEQVMEKLSGMRSGEIGEDGQYPEGSFNRCISERIEALLKMQIHFTSQFDNKSGTEGDKAV